MTPQIAEKGKGKYDKVGNWQVTRAPRPKTEAKLGPKPEGDHQEQERSPVIEFSAEELLKDMDTERKMRMEEKGEAPFLKCEEGETPIRVDGKVKPRVTTNQFNRRQVLFRVINGKDQQEYDLALSMDNPITRKLLEQIAKKNYVFTICRAGSGQRDTKYSLKGL